MNPNTLGALTDFSRDTDKQRKGMPGDRIHVIFMTGPGSDYCREQLPLLSAVTAEHTTACAAARELFKRTADRDARRHVTGFRIERW